MSRRASFAATIALHVAAVAALLQLEAVRRPLAEAIPLMVDILAPPPPAPPPVVEPARPLPVAKAVQPRRLPEPAPLLATQTAAATGFVAPAAAPAPPEPAPPVPAAAPPPVLPPAFDAAYLRNPPPAYPAMSRRRGEQGTVMLRVYVGADGSAQKVLVHASSGHESLDQAAHDAVHQWRFVPARQGGQAVAAWVLVPIRFALEK